MKLHSDVYDFRRICRVWEWCFPLHNLRVACLWVGFKAFCVYQSCARYNIWKIIWHKNHPSSSLLCLDVKCYINISILQKKLQILSVEILDAFL